MQARAPLMVEHRLIERMIVIIKQILIQIKEEDTVDPVFVDTTVDFIRIYADRPIMGKKRIFYSENWIKCSWLMKIDD